MKISLIIAFVFWFAGATAAPDYLQELAIWTQDNKTEKQQYIAFRKTFDLNQLEEVMNLEIFADARYLLWVNGTYVMRGPCRFNPSRPEYDTQNIAYLLKKGKNSIAVMVHHNGNNVNGKIMKGEPALIVRLVNNFGRKEQLVTDESWRYWDHLSFQPAHESWNSVADQIDGRIDRLEWTALTFDDSHWKKAKHKAGSLLGKIYPNQMPLPVEKALSPLIVLPQAVNLHTILPFRLEQGQEVIVDYGKMALIYPRLKLEAEAGCGITLNFALRYKDEKAHEVFGGNCKYITSKGMQEFILSDQWGSHYMILRCDKGSVLIHDIEIIERSFPFERLGSFVSNDTLLNDLWEMSVNTIEATTDDAYGSDARERNEWIQDGAKASFPCSRVSLAAPGSGGKSEMRLLKNIIRHAALSQLPDGRFRATYPTDRDDSDCHYFIDDYACQWVEALYTYTSMTGDKEFAHEMLPYLKAQLEWFEQHRTEKGLYLLREYTSFDNPLAYITCEGATINGFVFQSLHYAVKIGELLFANEMVLKYRERMSLLYTQYNKNLWNESEKAYNSGIKKDTLLAPTVHAQLIALQSGLVPNEKIESTRAWFLKNYKNKGMKHVCTNPDYQKMIDEKYGIQMPIIYYWVFNELYKMDTNNFDLEALSEMRRRWLYMVSLQKDAGTLSESFVNSDGRGSHESCHNYGVVPAFYLSSYVLGVRTEESVEKREIIIEPRLGDLQFAQGAVVTEHGLVKVEWERRADSQTLKFKGTLPKGIKATLRLPSTTKTAVKVNGKTAVRQARWLVVEGVEDHFEGEIPLQ